MFEHGTFGAVQLNLDDAVDALRADHRGHADIQILNSIFAVQISRTGEHALLVPEEALRHGDGGGSRRVIGGAAFEQVDNFGTAVTRALNDLVEPRLRSPLHLDEIGQRNAGNRGIANQRHHTVAMTAEHKRGHILDRYV